jgi:hypothetical protein
MAREFVSWVLAATIVVMLFLARDFVRFLRAIHGDRSIASRLIRSAALGFGWIMTLVVLILGNWSFLHLPLPDAMVIGLAVSLLVVCCWLWWKIRCWLKEVE